MKTYTVQFQVLVQVTITAETWTEAVARADSVTADDAIRTGDVIGVHDFDVYEETGA
jgi:hypothetical protein